MGRPSDARQRLIVAAREIIYIQSYEFVSVDELCAAASVNKSSFYHFFSSKRDLILVVLEESVAAARRDILEISFCRSPPSTRADLTPL